MPTNFEFETELFSELENKNKSKPLEPVSIADVLKFAEEPIPWLVENLLIQGGCSLLAAKPKVGKTTLSRCLALAVARGTEFLGQKTQMRNVLLMTLEDKLSEVGRHFRSMNANDADKIFILNAAPRSVSQLKEIIRKNNFGLVIIDTMVLGVRGLVDLNDYLQVSQAIAPYVQLARETNAHVMFCHHLSKRERGGGDQILGSTALFGSMDSVLLLDRQKQHRTFSTIARYGKDWPLARLNMTEQGHIEIGNKLDDETSIQSQILELMANSKSPMTEKEIETMVYGRTSEKRKFLRELLQQGMIFRSGAGLKNSPYQYSSRPL